MHISPCLHPVKIKHPYTGEEIIVPCGHCESCRMNKSNRWIQRLEQERRCWRYCYFFTLTYSDNFVPKLYREQFHESYIYYDSSCSHINKKLGTIFIKEIDLKTYDFDSEEYLEASNKFLAANKELCYLSSYDAQCFIKRYREYLKNYLVKNGYSKEDAKVRYYLAGEYGETTLRPHYHGLFFFESERQAKVCAEIVRKAWSFGNIYCKPAEDAAAHYVASYVTGSSNLPLIYRHKRIRPFALMSRCPAIGTLIYNSETISQMFYEGSVCQYLYNVRKNSVDSSPLWRTFVDRLYPKITGFSEINHFDRVRIYESCGKVEENFVDWCKYGRHSKYLDLYLKYLSCDYTQPQRLISLWYKCRRICAQASVFNISVTSYDNYIQEFYTSQDYQNLKKMYLFEQEYSQQYLVGSLAGIDLLWLQEMMSYSIDQVSYEELESLKGYGIDIDKFFSPDDNIRYPYHSSLLPHNSFDYQNQILLAAKYVNDKMVTKRKNEYLNKHPELQKLVFDIPERKDTPLDKIKFF